MDTTGQTDAQHDAQTAPPPPPSRADRLESLTRALTAYRSWADLLATPRPPKLYPPRCATRAQIAAVRELADAYDSAQEAAGRRLRADRGLPCWWEPGRLPGPPHPGYEVYLQPGGYRIEVPGLGPVGEVSDGDLSAYRRQQAVSVGEALRTLAGRLMRQAKEARGAPKGDESPSMNA